jgi:hypothetical protein
MSRVSRIQLVCAVGGTLAALLAVSSGAQAQVNLGPELGVAYRSSDPKLNPGFAVGARAEYKLVPMLAVGAYVLWYELGEDIPDIHSNTSFTAVGGRMRFMLPLPGSSFSPYAFAGLGYVRASYPEEFSVKPTMSTTPTAELTKHDGWFLEVPIGLGLAWKPFKVVQLSVDYALRPGFNYKGSAYEGAHPCNDKIGMSLLFGVALDF